VRKLLRFGTDESGISMLLGALLVAAAAVIGAISFDAAAYLANIQHAQWEAEGMATAAARALRQTGDEASALRAGRDWAYANGAEASSVECCAFGDMRPTGSPDGFTETVTAVSEAERDPLFLHLFGLPGELSSRRTATAQVVAAERGAVCPWGILGDASDSALDDGTYFGIEPGRVYALSFIAVPQSAGDSYHFDSPGEASPLQSRAKRLPQVRRALSKRTTSWQRSSPTTRSGQSLLEALSHHYSFESADGS
jgi:hypothetical protein